MLLPARHVCSEASLNQRFT